MIQAAVDEVVAIATTVNKATASLYSVTTHTRQTVRQTDVHSQTDANSERQTDRQT